MKTTERFNNAYHALVDAFYNNTLYYGNCAACAVGSIVARSNGLKVVGLSKENFEWRDRHNNWHPNRWSFLFMDGNIGDMTDPYGLDEIKPTGYSAEELLQLERFFKTQSNETGDNTFETLCALVDFLLKLDGMEPLESLHEGFKVGKEKAHEILQP